MRSRKMRHLCTQGDVRCEVANAQKHRHIWPLDIDGRGFLDGDPSYRVHTLFEWCHPDPDPYPYPLPMLVKIHPTDIKPKK